MQWSRLYGRCWRQEPVLEQEISSAMPASPEGWRLAGELPPGAVEDGGLLGVSCVMQEITGRKKS